MAATRPLQRERLVDSGRFDAALRALQTGTTRRRGLGALLGVLLGSGGAGLAAAGAGAQERGPDEGRARGGGRGHGRRARPRPEGPCGDGTRKDNRCRKDSQCCTGVCKKGLKNKDGSGRCRCLRRGKACTADLNCCRGMTCAGGVCVRGANGCSSDSDCPAATPFCSGGTCVECVETGDCQNGLVCCGQQCQAGSWQSTALFPTTNISTGVAVSADGIEAWVSDSVPIENTSPFTQWNRTSTAVNDWTQGGTCVAGEPGGRMAITPDGLTMAIQGSSTVLIWTRPDTAGEDWIEQSSFGQFGPQDNELQSNMGQAITSDALTVLVADMGNTRISVWSRTDATSTTWNHEVNFGSNVPYFGVAVSPDGLTAWAVYWTTVPDGGVEVWTRADSTSQVWTLATTIGTAADFGFSYDIAVSADGLAVWVVNLAYSNVAMWTRPDAASTSWTFAGTFGTQGTEPNQLNFPNALAVSADGQVVVVSDQNNSRGSVWERVCL
jgi:hypothetical protein